MVSSTDVVKLQLTHHQTQSHVFRNLFSDSINTNLDEKKEDR